MKRALSIFAIVIFLLFQTSVMWAGVTVGTPTTGKTSQGGSFIINAYSSAAQGCEELKAPPGSGKAIYIRTLSINSATPITVTIGEGETTPGSVDTILIGPLTFSSSATAMQWEFYPALKLTDNKSLVMDSSASGDVVVVIQGFIE